MVSVVQQGMLCCESEVKCLFSLFGSFVFLRGLWVDYRNGSMM